MTLHKSVAQFNDAMKNKTLLKLFEELQDVSSMAVFKSLRAQTDREEMKQFEFLPIKAIANNIIYLDEDGKLAACDVTSMAALNHLLNRVRMSQSETPYGDILRTLLLTASGGLLKSYDTYTTLDVEGLPKAEIKQLIKERKAWLEQRQRLHKTIIEDVLKDVRHLSNQIEKSEDVENSIYCMRGSVAAGKSTFAKTFFKRYSLDQQGLNGIISTDLIKRKLVKEAIRDYGMSAPGYLFHDEASMISTQILARAKERRAMRERRGWRISSGEVRHKPEKPRKPLEEIDAEGYTADGKPFLLRGRLKHLEKYYTRPLPYRWVEGVVPPRS